MQESVKIDRNKYIGGSDIPIIMGISPYKSRFELLLEKAEYKFDDSPSNIYTRYGNVMEEEIRSYLSKIYGMEFKEGLHKRDDIRIHTDGEAFQILTEYSFNHFVAEIKTTSHIYQSLEEYRAYLVQLLFYMEEVDLIDFVKSYGILAVYERPDNFKFQSEKEWIENFDPSRLQLFGVAPGDFTELKNHIIDEVDRFKEDLEKVKKNPFITEEELMPKDITSIAKKIIMFEDQLQAMKTIQKRLDDEKKNLKAAMEKAGVKSWETPNGYKVTLVGDVADIEKKEVYFDEQALKIENPEIYKLYLKEKTVIKRGRKGYVRITAPKGE